MKFIKNSIDTEYLQDTIADADLEIEMASFELKSGVFNGHKSESIKNSDKTNIEEIKLTSLSNGNHRKPGSPDKCNGKVNGFYEEEDFNLVLEDSSEGDESPSKKIDDDNISAPQIVQEIEDLLGITSSSDVIEEELKNLDGTESMEDNLDNVEDVEGSEDVREVLEEMCANKINGCQRTNGDKVNGKEEIKNDSIKNSETIECNTSSNMNLVFDEVEVGMESGDLSLLSESNLTVQKDDSKNRVESTTESLPKGLKDMVENDFKGTNNRLDDAQSENSKIDVLLENKSDEIPLSQISSISGNSEDWVVVDSVESSDEENVKEPKEPQELSFSIQNSVDDLPLTESSKSMNGIQSEVSSSVSTESDSTTVENLPHEKASDNATKENADCSVNTPSGNLTDENSPCATFSESEDPKSNTDSKIDDSFTDSKDTLKRQSISSLLLCEGDGVRKRCASVDDEEIKLKKPKLEDQSCLVESSSPVLKRPSTITTENENKRSKQSEDCDILSDKDCELNVTPDEVNNKNNLTMMDTETEQEISLENIEKLKTSTAKEFHGKPINKSEEAQSVVIENENSVQSSVYDESKKKLVTDISAERNISNSVASEEPSSSLDDSKITLKINEHSKVTTLLQDSNTLLSNSPILDSKESGKEVEIKSQCEPTKSISDEIKENQSSSCVDKSRETGFKLDDLSSIDKKDPSNVNLTTSKTETKKTESKEEVSISKELSTSIKELEKSIINNVHEKTHALKEPKSTGSKKMTNLDFAIERVIEKARVQTEKKIPILKKFHKDQLKKLKRSELEDIVVSKICEAVTYKSEIGQMRLRTQNLEETNEMWRKKVQQIEKQNRELEMVLKRFLAELAHIKRENQNKVPMPIKVTRSVGLQVVLASSMHGALVSSKSKMNSESSQQQGSKIRQSEKDKDKLKEPVKATTFIPPSQSALARGRGRPPKALSQNFSRSTSQTSQKVTPPTTPSKPPNSSPMKTIQTPNKDLEVIDLTDREERAKSNSQTPVSGSIRVSPSTQVCFVQQSSAPSTPQQPLYLVQKAGQRPQFLVATSSASPQRPNSNISRPPPALALPVFRTGGHLIPVQTSPQVGVKSNVNTVPIAVSRQVTSTSRIQQQPAVVKHPAPLPTAPAPITKPGMKAPPPKPQLKIAKTSNGIMLSWSMSLSKDMADMQSYQLYAYQEGNQPPSTGLWKKVGDVKALPLPMACTLTQFIEGHKYHFAVRAVDTHGRIGPFSTPSSILLTK